jgi:hypothetical protein
VVLGLAPAHHEAEQLQRNLTGAGVMTCPDPGPVAGRTGIRILPGQAGGA